MANGSCDTLGAGRFTFSLKIQNRIVIFCKYRSKRGRVEGTYKNSHFVLALGCGCSFQIVLSSLRSDNPAQRHRPFCGVPSNCTSLSSHCASSRALEVFYIQPADVPKNSLASVESAITQCRFLIKCMVKFCIKLSAKQEIQLCYI